ncbi:MAG: diguanylate cyclase [Selenomonadaceae bacterium]|nr:diguanylate cyclase [Selenomonadaceae bacterium]
MQEKNNSPSPILIFVAAIALNLLGAFVTRSFDLPLYLDTVGTISIAMMSGYVPAIVVGFLTHLLASFVDEAEMYYCSVSIFVAIYTTFLARRKVFKNFLKTLTAIPALALVATVLSEFIGKFLFCTGVVQALSEIQTHFAKNFLLEFADKGLTVLAAFVLLKFIPPSVKNIFSELGHKQAPLTREMRKAVYKRKCPLTSLRTKILLILMLSSLFIATAIASISYRIFEQAAVAVQIKIGDGLATIAADQIDPANLDASKENLLSIKHSNPDVKSLRVEKFSAEGARVVFNADMNSPPEENILPYLDDLRAGKPIPPIDNDDSLTIYKPVYDSAGAAQCYVAVELSLDLISDYGRTFTAKVLALFSGCFVFVFVVGLRLIENNIVLPVNTMDYCARNFSYENNRLCKNNLEQLRRLEIHTGDEIENLYHALLKTTQKVVESFEKLRRAKRQVAEMDELAHKDSLTGIKNKAAYDEATAQLDEKISAGAAEFCIAMVDVNFLKKINDTYGHERGNIYLLNASRLICSVFGAEHVYRIGGDEFVVILEDEKVSLSKYFVTQFKAEMERKNSNTSSEPWEKVSAAVGLATYRAGVDKTADEVFKRADAEMYENKLAMKAARTD